MITKSLKLICISLTLCLTLIAETTLLVHKTDGTVIQYPLSDLTDITFPVDGVRMMIVNNTSAADVTYTLSDISKLSISYPVTDYDDNVYQTATIGTQIWMVENLKVTHYRDGTAITNVTDGAAWAGLTTEAYCIFNNNASNEVDTSGALYNWYAATDAHNIAPTGWHVPTDNEWKELEMYFGMSQSEIDAEGFRGTNEGSKLADNAALWWNGALENDPEFGSSGFTALPGGYRHYPTGYYYNMGQGGYFWSATEDGSGSAWYRGLAYIFSDIHRYLYSKSYGFSIRCLRD